MMCEHPNNTFTSTQRTSIKPITEQNPGSLIDIFVIKDEKLGDFVNCINELRSEVTWIHSMDTPILASALVDDECNGLITLDSGITESRRIEEIFRKAKRHLYNEELKRH